MKLINCIERTIKLSDGTSLQPSRVVRCWCKSSQEDSHNYTIIARGLPKPQKDVKYIVSPQVLKIVKLEGRKDCISLRDIDLLVI